MGNCGDASCTFGVYLLRLYLCFSDSVGLTLVDGGGDRLAYGLLINCNLSMATCALSFTAMYLAKSRYTF